MAGDEQVEASFPRKNEAEQYLNDHRIFDLFSNMTSALIYERPGNYFILYKHNSRNGDVFERPYKYKAKKRKYLVSQANFDDISMRDEQI